jgi:DNA gyrase subunit A
VKTTARNGKVVSIMLVNEQSEVMVISQFGKIIRIDSKNIRECGRSSQGVRRKCSVCLPTLTLCP